MTTHSKQKPSQFIRSNRPNLSGINLFHLCVFAKDAR